jgi:hypothetical protein
VNAKPMHKCAHVLYMTDKCPWCEIERLQAEIGANPDWHNIADALRAELEQLASTGNRIVDQKMAIVAECERLRSVLSYYAAGKFDTGIRAKEALGDA